MSHDQLSEEGNQVVMYGEFLWVYDKEGKLMLKVKRSGNRLYKIIIESGESKCLMATSDELAWLWHSRPGHVNFQAINMMLKNNMVDGLPRIIQPNEVCSGCLMEK